MAIDFVIGKSIETACVKNSLVYPEDVYSFFVSNKDLFSIDITIITNIDPYDDFCFDISDIFRIIEVIHHIKSELSTLLNENSRLSDKILEFTELLSQTCDKAIQDNMKLFAIGD